MYYERLLGIYNTKRSITNEFPISLVAQLDDFINNNYTYNKKIFSPFHFANFAGIKADTALKFFMVFSNKDGIFDMIFYIDCPHSQCSSRIYLSFDDLKDYDNVVWCDECDNSYKVSDFASYIKVNFQLKEILESKACSSSYDENSAYDVLRGCDPSLKVQSPSSLDNQSKYQSKYDEGDNSNEDITLEEVVANNEIQNEPILNFLESITLFIHK